MKFVFKKSKIRHRCRHFEQYSAARPRFVTSFRPRDFFQIASDKPFNYHSGLWLFLSHIILSQTCSKLRNDSIEDFRLEKIHFADLVKDARSVAGFFPSRQFRVGGNDVT